jgi:hypothetical protein
MYVKNKDPWGVGDAISLAHLDNFETIYTEASSYLSSHNHDSSYYQKSQMEAAFAYSENDGSGSGIDADLLYHASGNLHASSFAGLGVPTGLVIMWSGASVPDGWHLCDGNAGTIDLRDKFVVGAGSAYNPGSTGGSLTFTVSGSISIEGHSLTIGEIPSHSHIFTDHYASTNGGAAGGTAYRGSTTTSRYTGMTGGDTAHGHSAGEGTAFTPGAVSALPYFYTLAFIQKI